MFISETTLRVRYAETDQMSYVYYGNYAQYYEVGRVEALRQLGTSYRQLEESGIMMPVVSMNINYKRPALYDDILTIKIIIKELPTTKMKFEYEIYNHEGVLINTAETILVFVNRSNMRPCRCPQWFVDLFEGIGLK
jgi:acyl-CoA thioester hydrolase